MQNKGAAFGIFHNQQVFLISVGILVLVAISIYRHRHAPIPLVLNTGLAFLIGGDLGNLSDRILRGSVVDFIKVPYFATFNVADIAINIGVAIISFYLIFSSEKKEIPDDNQNCHIDDSLPLEMTDLSNK